MIRDGCFGGLRPIEDYFGLSVESRGALMDRYYREFYLGGDPEER